MIKNKRSELKSIDYLDAEKANRAWWESHPMTYDWEKTLRISPGTLQWFDEIDRRFLDSAYYATEVNGPAFGRFMKPEFLKGKRVLEIGCGMGTHAELLIRNKARLTAIDQTTFAIDATRRRLALKQLEADVLQQDAENLVFQKDAFDFVWSWGVLHHSNSTERCIDQIARVLQPGGRLMMMVYYRPSLVYYLHCGLIRGILMGHLLRQSLDDIYLDSTDGFHARVFSKPELHNLLSGKFENIRMTVVGVKGELYPIPRTRFKISLERHTPDWLATAVLGRLGSMIVVEAVRV